MGTSTTYQFNLTFDLVVAIISDGLKMSVCMGWTYLWKKLADLYWKILTFRKIMSDFQSGKMTARVNKNNFERLGLKN
jgi:hypothetical protein